MPESSELASGRLFTCCALGPANEPVGLGTAASVQACGDSSTRDHEVLMKPLPHLYEVTLKDGPGGYATVFAGGPPELRMAPPVEFDGPGDAWSPEQLLVASVESCFLFTLRAVAAAPS